MLEVIQQSAEAHFSVPFVPRLHVILSSRNYFSTIFFSSRLHASYPLEIILCAKMGSGLKQVHHCQWRRWWLIWGMVPRLDDISPSRNNFSPYFVWKMLKSSSHPLEIISHQKNRQCENLHLTHPFSHQNLLSSFEIKIMWKSSSVMRLQLISMMYNHIMFLERVQICFC